MLFATLLTALPHVIADPQYSIPLNGRYSDLTITLDIQQEPRWAHDIVLNASIAWNQAQNWYDENFQAGPSYRFLESSSGSVKVNFGVPAAYSEFAVGWTDYKFAASPKNSIVSAQVYLDEGIFDAAQGGNSTVREYAFRLALHELGHVLGLGHLLDGKDIMDPRGPAYLSTKQPLLTTLDLYAIHLLASLANAPAFAYLPTSIPYRIVDASNFLLGEQSIPAPEFSGSHVIFSVLFAVVASLYLIRRRTRIT